MLPFATLFHIVLLMFFRERKTPDWEQALQPVLARLEQRLGELERGREQDRLERADWLDKLDRLYHRVRMRLKRETDHQDALDVPDAAPEGLGTIRAIRARMTR